MDSIPAPLVGGLLLSFATSSLLIDQGRILGCSGVAHATQAASTKRLLSFFSPNSPSTRETGGKDESWKTASVLGLVAGGFALSRSQGPLELLVGQTIFDGVVPGLLGRPIMAGFTVGLGTKLARGCTSGHMLLGMARLSARSIAATCTFFPFAMITARLFPYALPLNMSATIATLNLAYLTPSLSLLFLLPIATSILAHRIFPNRLASLLQSFSLSFLFSLGLALTGMLRPSKVLSFFYVPLSSASSKSLPPWDPSLALVALGGLLPNMIAWRTLVRDRASPRKREKWEVPTGGKIDTRLLVGSAIFGIGWGLAGVCPGPLLAVLGSKTGGSALALFAGAFAVGGFVGDKVQL